MHDMSAARSAASRAAHRVYPEARLQSRSQGYRRAVLRPGTGRGLHRHGALLDDAHSPGVAQCSHSRAALAFEERAPGGVITPEYYLQLMTMHGTIMVFFVLTNAPFAAFGNYFLPIQIGAEDMAFPRFNMMSFWVTFRAFLVADCRVLRSATVRRSPDGLPMRR